VGTELQLGKEKGGGEKYQIATSAIFDGFVVKVDPAKVLSGGLGCCFLRKVLSLRTYLW
jgi:hypothetical protein